MWLAQLTSFAFTEQYSNFWQFQLAIQNDSFTFFNLAAPVPERMASISACLASPGLLSAVVENVGAAVIDRWTGGGGGGGGWAGGGGIESSSAQEFSLFCEATSAFLKLRSSSEAADEIC